MPFKMNKQDRFITFLTYVVSVYITDAAIKKYSVTHTRMLYTLLLLCVFTFILALFALVSQNTFMFGILGMCALTLILFGLILYGLLKQSSYT
jgi:uncharacterized membrane protein YcaP (DUF421 family)